ncbi:hypothetical protein ACTHPH_01090 [Paenibacillus pasadenensis]
MDDFAIGFTIEKQSASQPASQPKLQPLRNRQQARFAIPNLKTRQSGGADASPLFSILSTLCLALLALPCLLGAALRS